MITRKINHSQARLALLRWTASVGPVTAEALAVRQTQSVACARAQLLGAQRAGLLSRRRPLTGAPSLYTLTRAGLRTAGLQGLDLPRVSAANARHAIVCAEVAAALEIAYPAHRLIGEQSLRHQERAERTELASARVRGARGVDALHRPDLVLWPGEGERSLPMAIEVELTVKAPRRLLDICRGWARCRCVAGVIYLAAPEVLRPLEHAIDGAQASQRVLVLALEALLGDGAGGSPPAIS
jgi:hypothetical protein